jgi:hypothetical protein
MRVEVMGEASLVMVPALWRVGDIVKNWRPNGELSSTLGIPAPSALFVSTEGVV